VAVEPSSFLEPHHFSETAASHFASAGPTRASAFRSYLDRSRPDRLRRVRRPCRSPNEHVGPPPHGVVGETMGVRIYLVMTIVSAFSVSAFSWWCTSSAITSRHAIQNAGDALLDRFRPAISGHTRRQPTTYQLPSSPSWVRANRRDEPLERSTRRTRSYANASLIGRSPPSSRAPRHICRLRPLMATILIVDAVPTTKVTVHPHSAAEAAR